MDESDVKHHKPNQNPVEKCIQTSQAKNDRLRVIGFVNLIARGNI